MVIDLYFHAELASSRCNAKGKWEVIHRQKIDGGGSHIVYIGHNPHVRPRSAVESTCSSVIFVRTDMHRLL